MIEIEPVVEYIGDQPIVKYNLIRDGEQWAYTYNKSQAEQIAGKEQEK